VTRRLLVLLLVAGGVAHADNSALVEARRAVQEVRYDDAERLLVDALKAGTSGTDELSEIYQLSAATASVLGQHELAEQYYRRLLAIDPDFTLAADTSPKLRTPFVAAQAYMAAQARLAARITRRGTSIEIAVTDPLGMVAAIGTASGGVIQAKQPYAGRAITVQAAPAAQVVLLDEYGNSLRTILADVVVEPRPEAPTPVVRRWQTWAIPAGVAAGVGIGFLIDGQRSKDQLDDIIAHDSTNFFQTADQARSRWHRDTIVADVAFGTAGGLAITAVVMAILRRSGTRAVVSIGPSEIGFAVKL